MSAVRVDDGAVTGVVTERGTVATGTVVCAAGPWSQPVAAMAGVELPVTPLRRQVVLTGPAAGLPPDLPMTIGFATSSSFHGEGCVLLMGMSDPDERPGFSLARSARPSRCAGSSPSPASPDTGS